MNSMNSSGEFQDIESNCSGRLSHVSSQREMIPSSRALLSCDKRLPLDTWNAALPGPRDLLQRTLYTQNNFLKSPYQKLHQTQSGRKASLKDHSHTLTLRVPETCATTLPQVCWKVLRSFRCLKCPWTLKCFKVLFLEVFRVLMVWCAFACSGCSSSA